jgi:5-formyltetrahydrofolate cyclo-ligase
MIGKREARAEARAELAALTPAERDAASGRVAALVWRLPPVAAARTLLLYASRPDEVATDAIAVEAARRGIEVIYPRCIVESRTMRLHRAPDARPPAGLRAGAYGLREPDPLLCPEVRLERVDVALVPGLAWDRAGRRLGRGAGYYDRLFADPAWRALRCGLFFAAQELDTVPADPWDVPLDVVVTDRETVWAPRSPLRKAES